MFGGVSTLNELCVVGAAVTGKHDAAFQESRKRPGILLAFYPWRRNLIANASVEQLV